MTDDPDSPDYRDTNAGLGMTDFETPEEKEIARLEREISKLRADKKITDQLCASGSEKIMELIAERNRLKEDELCMDWLEEQMGEQSVDFWDSLFGHHEGSFREAVSAARLAESQQRADQMNGAGK